jgi:hypothetical protein
VIARISILRLFAFCGVSGALSWPQLTNLQSGAAAAYFTIAHGSLVATAAEARSQRGFGADEAGCGSGGPFNGEVTHPLLRVESTRGVSYTLRLPAKPDESTPPWNREETGVQLPCGVGAACVSCGVNAPECPEGIVFVSAGQC